MTTEDNGKANASCSSNGSDCSAGDGEQDVQRRAAIALMGRMAALNSPALLTLLMSSRASAESPPNDFGPPIDPLD